MSRKSVHVTYRKDDGKIRLSQSYGNDPKNSESKTTSKKTNKKSSK